MMDDLEEFFSLVGSDNIPTYHFYILPSDLIWEVRIEDDRPKKDVDPWRLVWVHRHVNSSLGGGKILDKIELEIGKKKARKMIHRGTPDHWSGGDAA